MNRAGSSEEASVADSSKGLEKASSTGKDASDAQVQQLSASNTTTDEPREKQFYEKAGLRTDGDDYDHDHEPPMSFSRVMSLVSMAFLWTGSQIPVYLFGGVPPYIYADIGGTDRWIWFVLANLLALAAVCPFVGSLSDLVGGMALSGVGAGINELTALAATSELAPTRKRGTYVAVLVFTVLPFCPSVLWGQLIAAHSHWRYIGLFCGLWAFVGLLTTGFFYFPPPRVNSQGLSRRQVIRQIDFVGGFLSIAGMIMFMAGLQWGGYQYSWRSAHTLVPLLLGIALLVAFVVWEIYFAKYPMFPSRLKQEPRILALTLVITFISGANFFSVLLFWPTQAFNVYGHDPIQVGLRGLPIGFGILFGACICLWLLSVFRGHNKELMIVSSVLMTAGCGSLAVANTTNLATLWGLLVIAGLGIGGIVVPASIITTIICPDDLIATIAALTLTIRVLGGAIGYTTYFNVFINKFVPNAKHFIGGAMMEMGIKNAKHIAHAIEITGESLLPELRNIPGIAGNETRYQIVVAAGQMAYAESYKYVYYTSIAFGCVSIIASCFLGDISKFMDDHVAVVM
ncbi:MAG: hypothetical protein M1832_006279 [Thelocarpon impressellum]|nr:MAG: hypothetical protein M1832_006279 [Thelocarpon impressellum]